MEIGCFQFREVKLVEFWYKENGKRGFLGQNELVSISKLALSSLLFYSRHQLLECQKTPTLRFLQISRFFHSYDLNTAFTFWAFSHSKNTHVPPNSQKARTLRIQKKSNLEVTQELSFCALRFDLSISTPKGLNVLHHWLFLPKQRIESSHQKHTLHDI